MGSSMRTYWKHGVASMVAIIAFSLTAFSQTSGSGSCNNCYGYYYCALNDYLVVAARKDRVSAEKIAIECSQKLNIPFRTRVKGPDAVTGLIVYYTDTCRTYGVPGTYAFGEVRGLRGVNAEEEDNGLYVTVEWSGSYA